MNNLAFDTRTFALISVGFKGVCQFAGTAYKESRRPAGASATAGWN